MNGTMQKWLLKSLGSLTLASAVVLVPVILTGCGEDSSGPAVPVPPPPPPAPPAPPAPPPPTPTPTPRPSGTVNVTPESNISQIIASSDPAQPLTIVLQPGVYRQNIVINRSNVTVRGATGLVGDAIVVGAATGAPVQVTNNAAGVVLENFSILNTRSLAPIEYGINAEDATEVTVTGVDIVLFPTVTPPASRGVAIGFGSPAAGTTSKNLTVTRSNLFVAGAANSAGIRIAGDNAGINLRVETNNIFLGYAAPPAGPLTQLIPPAAQDVGAGSAAIFIEPAVTGLSLAFAGNIITPRIPVANVYAIRDDRGSGLSAAERRAIVAAGDGFAFNSNTSNVYLSITRAIAEAAGPNPTVTAGPGNFIAEGEIVIPANRPGLTLNSLDGRSTLRNVKILADNATLGGAEGNGFRITGTLGRDPDAGGPAVDYQVGIGECDLANQGARNVEVSFNDFARPTQADTYVSVQVCDFSQANISNNLLRGYTVAGVHVVAAEPATVTIRENRFEASINSPVFVADIVDRQTQATGNLSPFAKAAVTGNVFTQPPQGAGAIYARPSVDLTPTAAGALGGEGTILQAFFNNTITPTPSPGFVVCGRLEALAGAPGNLVNFLDRSPALAPFTSNVFGVVADALCSAVGFGPGASLQFRPGGAPPAPPAPAGPQITIPGLPAGATVTIRQADGTVIATSTSVSGDVATFSGPFTIPFGGQIRVTPAIASPQPITVGGTTLSTFDNTTNPGSTTYFNFGPAISVN